MEDLKIAPRVGESATYRTFLKSEVIPFETFLLQPELFDTYLAVSPSLWWNDQKLVKDSPPKLKTQDATPRQLYVAVEQESLGYGVKDLKATLKKSAVKTLRWQVDAFPGETHGTVFHPAALKGLRWAYGPSPAAK